MVCVPVDPPRSIIQKDDSFSVILRSGATKNLFYRWHEGYRNLRNKILATA